MRFTQRELGEGRRADRDAASLSGATELVSQSMQALGNEMQVDRSPRSEGRLPCPTNAPIECDELDRSVLSAPAVGVGASLLGVPRWLFWTLVALVAWGVWGVLSKVIGESLSPAHIQAISTIGMLPIIAILAGLGRSDHSGNPRLGIALAIAAGVVSCLGNMPFYGLLAGGAKAATVVPLTALYPLVTIVLAVALLGERLNRIQLLGVVISLTAVYMLNVRDEQGMISIDLLPAALATALWGLAGFLQKVATIHISGTRAAAWFLGAFVPVAVIILLREPAPGPIAWQVWALAGSLGFLLALGNLAILLAFAYHGKAAVVTPLASLYPLVTIPLAITLLGESIAWREQCGILLALAAVVALTREATPIEISTNRCTTDVQPANKEHS